MELFTDFPKKISAIEKNSWKTYFPRNEKMSTEKLLVPSCEMKEGTFV